MKTLRFICLLVVVVGMTGSFAVAKESASPPAPKIPIIPGDPGRPYEMIDKVYGTFEVVYKVTFTKGVGAQASYNDTVLELFDAVRETAKKSGADAVINAQIDFVSLPDSVIRDEQELRGARVIGLIKFFGTQVRFLPRPETAKSTQ